MSSPANHVALPRLGAILVAAALGAAACTGSATTATTAPTAVAQATAAASLPPVATAAPTAVPTDSAMPSSAAATSAASDGPTAVPTSLDPCQLIPAAEAGKLAGATFGSGKEETTSGNGRLCVYGSQTTNVFEVGLAVAPDEATAKQDETAALAEVQSKAAELTAHGLPTPTQLPNFAPGVDAVLIDGTINAGAASIGVAGMYVLKGTTFFSFVDEVVGHAPPSADAMKAEAMTVLGRLP